MKIESLCIFVIQNQQDDQEPKKHILDFIFPINSTLCCGLSFLTINGIAYSSSSGYNFCKSVRPHLVFTLCLLLQRH